VNQVLTQAPAQGYDYWSYMMSVPAHLGARFTARETNVPYLRADPELVQGVGKTIDALARGKLKVGLVWSGSTSHNNNRFRSTSPEMLLPLLQMEKLSWFLLHVDPQSLEAAKKLPAQLHLPLKESDDFADTAAVIANLDLVISVDTSVAHLAAGLGKPTWILLPANPDWRWGLSGEQTLWYPSARLFRQKTLGDWQPVIEDIRDKLNSM
jgi:ADP-heptose:LPS heptosyltransferase